MLVLCGRNEGTYVFEALYLSKNNNTMNKKKDSSNTSWIIQPCSIKQLAEVYNVSIKIIRGHLKPIQKEIGKRIGHSYNMKQVLFIVDHLGIPPHIELIYPQPIPAINSR